MSGVRVNIPALRPLLVQAASGNPISADDAWALIHGWDALVEAVEAAQNIDLLYLLHDKAEPDSKAHAAFVRLMAALEPFDPEFDKAVT